MRCVPPATIIALLLLVACTDGGAPEQAAAKTPVSEPPAAASPPPSTPPQVVQPPAPPKPEGWIIQYQFKPDGVDPLAGQPVDASLRRFTLRFSVHRELLYSRPLDFAAIGEFASAAAAQAELDRLTAGRPEGFAGVVRDLSDCNLVHRSDTIFECLDREGNRFNPLVVYPPPYETVDPAARVSPEPLAHAPADAVLVVASDEVFKPGHAGIDRAPKYRTWIWTPEIGPLPRKLAPTEPASSEPAALEQIDGLFVFAKGERHELVAGETNFSYSQCDCSDWNIEYTSYGLRGEDVAMTVRTLEVVRGDGQRELLLMPAAVSDAIGCLEIASALQADYQVVAVAGPRVFVVERQRATECDEFLDIEMYMQVFDLEHGAVELVSLERELPPGEIAELRKRAAWTLGEMLAQYPWDDDWWSVYVRGGADPDWAKRLWPDELELSAVFPDYRSKREGEALILQYQLMVDSDQYSEPYEFYRGQEPKGMRDGSKDWSTWTWTTRLSMALPKSSSLRPPDDAQSLIEHVRSEHRGWKVIGWSRRVAPPASETELPNIASDPP
jgi:hypothetical protein